MLLSGTVAMMQILEALTSEGLTVDESMRKDTVNSMSAIWSSVRSSMAKGVTP